MHRRRFLETLSVGTAVGVAGCSAREYDGETGGPPRLRVDGRWLTDPDGNPVVLRGVSLVDPVWSAEHEDERDGDYWETLRLATDEDAGWHATVLRIPVEPRSISAVGLDAVLEEYLDRAVELAAERGCYVLIDYHAIERYDTPSIDRRLRAFWDGVAPRYADESHVLYELFSEPTEPAAGGLEAWRTWRERASPWVSLVREHAPEIPIVVGSPAWSSMTEFAAEEPFEHDELLYSAHVYPSWEPRQWEAAFGTSAFEVPVFVTEWGYANVEASNPADYVRGTTEEWGEPFREWADAHENIHWCATTFDSRRQPAMLNADGTVRGGPDNMGSLVKNWLAERRTDHRPGESTPIPTGEGSPPSPPEQIEISRVGETDATIHWSDATDPDGDDVLQYRVTADDRDPTVLRGTERSTVLRNLEPGRDHEGRVTAVDERGLESQPATARFRTPERAVPEATLPRAASSPTVDRVDEGWRSADARAVETFIWGDSLPDIAAEWRALWDEEALYVLVAVTDSDEGKRDADIELYFDPDNSRGTTYDGENDLQMVVPRGTETAVAGSNSAPIAAGTEVETVETDDEWRTMLAVPWANYGVRPVVGHRVGMDVHIALKNDGERSGKLSWFDESDSAWQNPEQFATVELGE